MTAPGTVRPVGDDLQLRQAGGDDISAVDLYALLLLRSEVFVVEQACAYLDPDGRDVEPDTTHLWLVADDGTVASTIRVLTEPDGGQRIGRVVTAPNHRGHGWRAGSSTRPSPPLTGRWCSTPSPTWCTSTPGTASSQPAPSTWTSASCTRRCASADRRP